MITPTVGRVVWVRNRLDSWQGGPAHPGEDQPEVAFVTYVHSDTRINVAGFDAIGRSFALQSLELTSDCAPQYRPYAEWMPYQKGQAAKAEALEAKLGA